MFCSNAGGLLTSGGFMEDRVGGMMGGATDLVGEGNKIGCS